MVAGTVKGNAEVAAPQPFSVPHDPLYVTRPDIAPDFVPFPTQSNAGGAQQNEQRYICGNPAGRGGQHP